MLISSHCIEDLAVLVVALVFAHEDVQLVDQFSLHLGKRPVF